jgi:hypothetical protein
MVTNMQADPEAATRNVRSTGTVEWLDSSGQFHNKDGPAIEYVIGIHEWYRHGLLHREDGPAEVNCADGTGKWYLNGVLHRLGGPAVVKCMPWLLDEYWVHGARFSEDEYYRYVDQLTGQVFVPPGRSLLYKNLTYERYR